MDLDTLVKEAKSKLDLADVAHQASLNHLTEKLFALPGLNLEQIQSEARKAGTPLEFKIAAKLYESKHFLLQNKKPLKMGVIFAMWGEQNRLQPKSVDNPNGEDSLRVKIEQLQWATQDTPIEWRLYAVDDGCPHQSGQLAQDMIADHRLKSQVVVLHLEDALPQSSGPLAGLNSVNESRKGGAITLGAQTAIADGMDVVIMTDADNSVHLGQIGLLLKPYCEQNTRVVLGNRKHPDAVLVKQEGRWGVGIKLLRHMQRMVGQAIFSQGILDTQAAFKLYASGFLASLIAVPTVYDYSFDTDWIAGTIAQKEAFAKVPFAFVDSFAESASITQGPMTTWETLLKGLVKEVRKHGLEHSALMAQVLDEEIRSSADLDLLINHLPPELAGIADQDLGNPEVMSPEQIRAWIQLRKSSV